MSLLKIEDLHLGLRTGAGVVHALQGVNLHVEAGEVLALVGESGCGKTVTMQTVLGLFPPQDIAYRHGRVLLEGRDLLALSEAEMRRIRGGAIAMVFQDPMTALNPTLTIGTQIAEAIQAHRQVSRAEARRLAVGLLAQVEVPQPEMRAGQFSLQLSGGLRQHAVIAPRLAVMCGGGVVGEAPIGEIFAGPSHPYTWGLLDCLPRLDAVRGQKLRSIEGAPPALMDRPAGCPFADRCPHAMDVCDQWPPPMLPAGDGHQAACWLLHPSASAVAPTTRLRLSVAHKG